MPFPVQRYVRTLNQFCVATGSFTEEDVDRILDLEDLQKFQKGAIGGGSGQGALVNKKTRDSDVQWITHDPNSDWLFQKFSTLVSQVNYDHFMYDIDGFDTFQYTIYKAKTKQHYDWHIDSGNVYSKYERKISASIILTDPEKYEGGEFECILHGRVDEPFVVKPKKGDVIFFSSWMPHRVRPVTSGVRKSVVCWVMGLRTH
jgi:PKHD-type hydroxylase